MLLASIVDWLQPVLAAKLLDPVTRTGDNSKLFGQCLTLAATRISEGRHFFEHTVYKVALQGSIYTNVVVPSSCVKLIVPHSLDPASYVR
eukprot:6176397-Pleurochrysis_carterae.AAC.1